MVGLNGDRLRRWLARNGPYRNGEMPFERHESVPQLENGERSTNPGDPEHSTEVMSSDDSQQVPKEVEEAPWGVRPAPDATQTSQRS